MYFYIFQKLNSERVNVKKCNFVYFPSLCWTKKRTSKPRYTELSDLCMLHPYY